ncbi:MAG: phospholipase D-like domain-containing protein [Beijerinckiaceae bacterium]|nr:phospholipase D-like domain-containing protein [Beijerinckiaceae bacterium]
MRKARHSIFILGWDFDSRIRLRPDVPGSPTLGDLLRELVDQHSQLEVRALIWSAAVVHAPSEPKQLLLGAEWDKHERIKIKLDTFHPIYAAHHQKVVVIDDSIAFAGGMDLTVRRWDSHPHMVDNPARVSPEGAPYAPIHDVQMAVDADAAASLADMARDRWLRATGEDLSPCSERHDIWPATLPADFVENNIAVARTYPQLGECESVTEVERLTRASLRLARKHIYIEQQYMTAPFVGDILRDHLRKPDGPEIMVLMTRESRGIVERLVMGHNRDRLIRRLKKHDHHGRLRVCYPTIRSENGDAQVMVHSKLMVIDDWFLRIGSANLNNRSMGLDSECDLAIEAHDQDARQAINRLRWRLIGEHLDAEPQVIAAHADISGSMIATIDHFNKNGRGFECFEAMTNRGPTRPVLGTSILDPARPFEPLWFLRRKKRRNT